MRNTKGNKTKPESLPNYAVHAWLAPALTANSFLAFTMPTIAGTTVAAGLPMETGRATGLTRPAPAVKKVWRSEPDLLADGQDAGDRPDGQHLGQLWSRL